MKGNWIFLISYLGVVCCNHSAFKSEKVSIRIADTTSPFVGVVEFTVKLVDPSAPPNSKPVWSVPAKVWYRDSMAIEEVPTLHFHTDSKNNTTTTIDINNFRFVDLRRRSIYVYNSFSDSATIVKKYSFDDKRVETPGGWQFNTKKDSDYIEKPERLADTTIEGVNYLRIKLQRKRDGLIYFSTLFFRCDISPSPFTFYNELTKQIGCPAVKFVSEYPNHKKFSTIEELNFLRGEFTPAEMNVFNAWARNAANY